MPLELVMRFTLALSRVMQAAVTLLWCHGLTSADNYIPHSGLLTPSLPQMRSGGELEEGKTHGSK